MYVRTKNVTLSTKALEIGKMIELTKLPLFVDLVDKEVDFTVV